LDITAEAPLDKSQSMFVQQRRLFNKSGSRGGANHNINASTHKNSENELQDALSGNLLDGDDNKDDNTSHPSSRTYERMILSDDEMKPHSMFVKGVKFGGLKKTKETRFD
jgi:hypothetical protein